MQLRFKVAGMSDVGLVRTNNEDNFQISRDLSVSPMRWVNNEACMLTKNGTLLVVADGMGGMNAGEVASQIAIDTVKEVFSPEAISRVNTSSVADINSYIAAAVAEADRRIKAVAATRPETRGMGTTLVIAWLIDNKLYVGWCGDSRAYLYNPATGLRRLTKDHSYVQTLVDAGKLTDDQAFDYPQSNIITRCLSDSTTAAEADVLPEPIIVADGDIILLCTDGLCGMIRDYETEAILAAGIPADLTATAKNLIDGALTASGADNVTVALLQVVSGGVKADKRVLPPPFGMPLPPPAPGAPGQAAPSQNPAGQQGLPPAKQSFLQDKKTILTACICVVVGVITTLLILSLRKNSDDATTADADNIEALTDSTTTTNDNQDNEIIGQQATTAETYAGGNGTDASQTVAGILSNLSIGTNPPGAAAGTPAGAPAGASAGTTHHDSISENDSNPLNVDPGPEIEIITVETKGLRNILLDHGMNYDQLEALNPDVDFDNINETTKLKVYKKKAK